MEDRSTPRTSSRIQEYWKCCGISCCKKTPKENKNISTVSLIPPVDTPWSSGTSCYMLGFVETSDFILFLYYLFAKVVRSMINDKSRTNVKITSNEQKPIYCGDLPHPLLPGHCVEILGIPLNNCTRFSVNFQCEKKPESDLALHFNPRLDMKYIVRNSRVSGAWQKEESVSPYVFQLPREKNFRLLFFIAPKEFLISINGLHFCSFPYRIPIAKVRYVCIHGELNIFEVNIKELSSYPNEDNTSKLFQIPFKDIYEENEILPNPFIGHLPKGIKPGWQIEIYGRVKLLPHSFYINLQEGSQYWPHPNIPLHLNPRFNTTLHSHSMVRNTWADGSWGQEEVTPGFHFVPSKKFRLTIQVETDRYLVWVDGKLEGEFKFRKDIRYIDTIYIQGDVYLYKVFVSESITNMFQDYY